MFHWTEPGRLASRSLWREDSGATSRVSMSLQPQERATTTCHLSADEEGSVQCEEGSVAAAYLCQSVAPWWAPPLLSTLTSPPNAVLTAGSSSVAAATVSHDEPPL